MFEASCHCGNVQLSAERPPDSVTACNCSICRRYAALWAYYPPEQVQIRHRDETTRTYCWSEKLIDFHHCPHCGCLTHYTATELSDRPRTAVNARMADPQQLEGVRVRRFDGADSWTVID